MTDLAKETNQEFEMAIEETEEKRESNDYDTSARPINSDFLYELNLMIVLLSIFSLSPEDCVDCAKVETKRVKNDEAKAGISRLYSRKRDRDLHDAKPLVRRTQRFQSMIKDSRHGRKM